MHGPMNVKLQIYCNRSNGSWKYVDQKAFPVKILFSEDSKRKKTISNLFHELLICAIEWLLIKELY
jgi:hypothetical protein